MQGPNKIVLREHGASSLNRWPNRSATHDRKTTTEQHLRRKVPAQKSDPSNVKSGSRTIYEFGKSGTSAYLFQVGKNVLN